MDAHAWATTFYDILLKELKGAFDRLPQKTDPSVVLEKIVGVLQKVYAEIPSNTGESLAPPSSLMEELNAASSELMQSFGQGLRTYLIAAHRALSGDFSQPLDDLSMDVIQTACNGMQNIHKRIQEKLR